MNKSMTTEKALEILQEIKCDFKNKCCTSIDLGNIEAIDVAISALEKQIPKKPISIKNDEDVKIGAGTWKAGVTVYKCSCCNSFISRSSDFCPDCGQALDWSDEE